MNKYNPHIHHRRSIRLKGYDYAQAGLYFVTICCDNRICRFGNIDNGEMILNEFGTIAYNEWQKLSERFNNFELDVFQIMPNHIHGIIVLNNVGATLAVAQNGGGDTQNGDVDTQKGGQRNDNIGATARVAPTISDIVGAYKSLVANGCLEIYKTRNETMGKLWQRNYYEHIIRNKKSYETISNYIINNPAKWAEDKFYSKNA
jgi:putative transposase